MIPSWLTKVILPAVVAVAAMVLYLKQRSDSQTWLIPIMIFGKLYSNAMMVNFNQRMQFSGGRHDTQTRSDPDIISGLLFQVPESAVEKDVEIYELR
jgi:hypothetical protein